MADGGVTPLLPLAARVPGGALCFCWSRWLGGGVARAWVGSGVGSGVVAWGVEQIVRRGSRALLDLERASWRAVRANIDESNRGI